MGENNVPMFSDEVVRKYNPNQLENKEKNENSGPASIPTMTRMTKKQPFALLKSLITTPYPGVNMDNNESSREIIVKRMAGYENILDKEVGLIEQVTHLENKRAMETYNSTTINNTRINTAERTFANMQQQNNQRKPEYVDGFEIND